MDEFRLSCLKEDGHYHKICRTCNEEFQIRFDHKFWEALKCRKCSKSNNLEKAKNLKQFQFGRKGVCSDGHKFSSTNEQDFDEWLVSKNIKHIVQTRLLPTLCRSDFYLPYYDLHIEVDGLDRKDDIDWEGKLQLYDDLGLDYIISKPCSFGVEEDKAACFAELDSKVLPLLKERNINGL
jgi:hypothetical protein